MDSEYSIEVKHVCKSFNTDSGNRKIKDYLIYHQNKEKKKVTILDDINFSVKKGEVLGIIGRNGSGKSTILKLLSRIIKPNSGTIEMRGRTSCLIELGAGFHPDMTGRENTYINASIFGISNKTVDERFQDILDFSEIGEHIDKKVRNYSSGMYMRLAFSIAINVDADILLIDEILAVGDLHFQKKCSDKLHEIKDKGTTIVIVTQSTQQIRDLCDKVIWIDDGKIREIGDPSTVCSHYEIDMIGATSNAAVCNKKVD